MISMLCFFWLVRLAALSGEISSGNDAASGPGEYTSGNVGSGDAASGEPSSGGSYDARVEACNAADEAQFQRLNSIVKQIIFKVFASQNVSFSNCV